MVAEEADESVLWLELLEDTQILASRQLQDISKEARELAAIFSASHKTGQKQQIGRWSNYPITNLFTYQLNHFGCGDGCGAPGGTCFP